ncbi:hypothetical protein [uncultured Algimonas sp.]|uniref:hypothetical protein n=1 Tax=uncultured Algimonas sp. TaxID=1547920 RepID=UPI002633FB5E|nr:hypothetical protein [uncultured Algimonas sp.]
MPNLRLPLFLTRLSIFYFLLPWQVMRFTNPDQIDKIADTYYHTSGGIPDWVNLAVGAFWIALLIAFVIGFKKRVTYGLVFILHVGAILISVQAYVWGLESFQQIFLAALPASAAMGLLYLLRDQDTLLALK